MRQAGRYLPEYRAIRQKASLLEICRDPDLATTVTLQPVERLGVDAAILFADILLPFEPLGLGLRFVTGEGPVIDRPVRSVEDVARLPKVDVESDLGYVLSNVRRIRAALDPTLPLIGFAGAPFTLASYAIEGGATRTFSLTKRFMYNAPDAWHDLMERLANLIGRYLVAQAGAGASALQVFDSWAGCLSPSDYERFVMPHSATAIAAARGAGVPVIHFGTGTASFLDAFARAGGDVIGVDWRVPLDRAWAQFPDRAIQGNLDPSALQAPLQELERAVGEVLQRAAGRPGHIFNLGHGILPDTDPDRVRAVVEMVREMSVPVNAVRGTTRSADGE